MMEGLKAASSETRKVGRVPIRRRVNEKMCQVMELGGVNKERTWSTWGLGGNEVSRHMSLIKVVNGKPSLLWIQV